MKNKEKTKPTKKKILTLYLTLAACLLVIAAVTVSVIFGVDWHRGDNVIDKGNENPEVPEDPDDPVDTSSQYEFIVPVKDVQLAQAHVFWHDKTMNWYCLHQGMDFTAEEGTEVFAAVDGTVVSVTRSDTFYGGTVTLSHANNVTTVYAFIDPDEELKPGDKVNRGDVIGTVAKACGVESEEGDHLHFEVYKNGVIEDPDDYLDIIQK